MLYVDSKKVIPELMERLVDCLDTNNNIYCIGDSADLSSVCKTINIRSIISLNGIEEKNVFYISDTENLEWNQVKEYVQKEALFVVRTFDELTVPSDIPCVTYDMRNINLTGNLLLLGKIFNYSSKNLRRDFKVLAIIHFYNEEDVLETTVRYLLNQSIDIYLLDNYSVDSSYRIAQSLREEYPDRIYLERFPLDGEKVQKHTYEWYKQLARTEEIAKEKNYDWFIHYDADEIRVSPWEGVCLRDAIAYIDALGYNCIENTVIDFRMTNFDDKIFDNGRYFSMRENVFSHQLKTWKKNEQIDIKSSGGHEVLFQKPRLFPLKILNKHYPYRSIEQAYKKVFLERQVDASVEEKTKRGWHVHYNKIMRKEDFIFDKRDLLEWGEKTYKELYLPLFTECGLIKYFKAERDIPNVQNKRIIVYGAGDYGEYVVRVLSNSNEIVGWFDKKYEYMGRKLGIKVINPKEINDMEFDYIVVALKNESNRNIVKAWLLQNGADSEEIY